MRSKYIQSRNVQPNSKGIILRATENTCQRCGRFTAYTGLETIDHIVPLSRGGINDKKNLTCLCRKCNKIKGNEVWLPSMFYNAMPKKIAQAKDAMVMKWASRNITLEDIFYRPLVFNTLTFSVKMGRHRDFKVVLGHRDGTCFRFQLQYMNDYDRDDVLQLFRTEGRVGLQEALEPIEGVATYILYELSSDEVQAVLKVQEVDGVIDIQIPYCRCKRRLALIIYQMVVTLQPVYDAIEITSVRVRSISETVLLHLRTICSGSDSLRSTSNYDNILKRTLNVCLEYRRPSNTEGEMISGKTEESLQGVN